jgi:hypothetical protein
VYAGDQVTLLAQARLPQLFGDKGALNRRACLRSQGIDLTAALRLPELLEPITPASLSPRQQRRDPMVTDGEKSQISRCVACPESTAHVNSAKPQSPQDQQSSQQQ